MTNNLTNEQFYGIVIGPSVGGGCILLAAIVLAIVCYVRERKRRKATGHESSSSSTSLFRESRQHNFRFPMFSTTRKDKKHGSDPNDVRYATGHLIQPWTEGSGKIFTIPITPSDSSKLSSPESSINKEPITANNKNLAKNYNNSVTDKYFYQFDIQSRNTTDTPTAPISNNPNTTQAISSSGTITTPITSIISPMIRRSREVDHIISPQNHKQVVPPRNSSTSENAVFQYLDSVISVYEYNEPSNLMV